MLIRYGFNIDIEIAQPTTNLTALEVEAARRVDIVAEQPFKVTSAAACEAVSDPFGNRCRRIEGLPGTVSLSAQGILRDSGAPILSRLVRAIARWRTYRSRRSPFLRGSRYCETICSPSSPGRPSAASRGGWARVQAICDFVHGHITFGYQHPRHAHGRGSPSGARRRLPRLRPSGHHACRCMNIPARYCTGYLGDIGVPPDPRHGFQRLVRGLSRRPLVHVRCAPQHAPHRPHRGGPWSRCHGHSHALHTFGPHVLRRFDVITEEIAEKSTPSPPMTSRHAAAASPPQYAGA